MKKILSAILGTFALTFALSGPKRETDCMRFMYYQPDSDGRQEVIFDGETYPALWFNPNALMPGHEYRAKLRSFYAGLGEEKITGTEECQRETPITNNVILTN